MNRLETLLARMKAIQDEFKGKAMPEKEGKEFNDLALEAKALQDESDRQKAIEAVTGQAAAAKALTTTTVPDDAQPGAGSKAVDGSGIAGYVTLGDFVAASKGIRDFVAGGMPKQTALIVALKGFRHHGQPLVALTPELVKSIKAIPTLAAGVIEPTRLSDFVRVTEHDRLRMRDVLDLSTTDSDAVKYTRLTSYTRAAATVAPSATKPQAALAIDSITETVRTIAVWIPVENQQLADFRQLAGIINGELLYDIDKHEEELVVYGDGTGEDFLGIVNTPGVEAARSEGGDTLIDIARRGITDVTRAGYEPNAILVDPLDWESIVLEKGSDNRYVWVVVTDGATQRLWAVPVIETVAMQNFEGLETEQRNLIVGDFRRGATLWDREQSSISIGWIDQQFIKNQRTILAEKRAAFGVKRPGAFRIYETQAASAS